MKGESSLKHFVAFVVSVALLLFPFSTVAFAACYDSDGNELSFANMDDYHQFIYYCQDNNIIDLTTQRCIIYRGMYSSLYGNAGTTRYYYGYVTFADDATYAYAVPYERVVGSDTYLIPQIVTDGTIISHRLGGRITWPFARGANVFSVGSFTNFRSSDLVSIETLYEDFEICASNLMDFSNDGTIPNRVWDCPLTASLVGDEYGFDILVHAKDVDHEVAIESFKDPNNIPCYDVTWSFDDVSFFEETGETNSYLPASFPRFNYLGERLPRGSYFSGYAFSLDYVSRHSILSHMSKYQMSQPVFETGAFLIGHHYQVNFWCVAPENYGYSVKFCTIDFTLGDNYQINGVVVKNNISKDDIPSLDPTFDTDISYDFSRPGSYNFDDPQLEDFDFDVEFDDELVQSTGFIKALFDEILNRAGLEGFFIAVLALSVGAWFLYGRFKGG